jgi:serine protease
MMLLRMAVSAAMLISSVGSPIAGQPTDGHGLARQLHLTQAWQDSRGSGVVIGLVDTGVNANEPLLAGKVLPGKEFPDLGAGSSDAIGHGTTMALLINEVAPDARILPARLDGAADDANAAIRWVVDHGATVVNLSLGAGGHTAVYDPGIRYAWEHGAIVVAAGDTQEDDGVTSPADRPDVLAVSAVDATGTFRGDVSVSGPAVALSAPGTDLVTGRRGETGPTSGTSQAAAIVSGVAALVRSRFPADTPDQVSARLTSTADDRGPPGRDPRYGFGIVDPPGALTAPDPSRTDPSRTGPGGFAWWQGVAIGGAVVVLGTVVLLLRRRRRARRLASRAGRRAPGRA